MEKYGVDHEKVKKLLKEGLASSEQDALEKVASGEADRLIDAKKRGRLDTLGNIRVGLMTASDDLRRRSSYDQYRSDQLRRVATMLDEYEWVGSRVEEF